MAEPRTRYLIVRGEAEGEISESDITLVAFTDDEAAEFPEKAWTRGVAPDILIPVSAIKACLKRKSLYFDEYFDEED
jgi:hypothetical protein